MNSLLLFAALIFAVVARADWNVKDAGAKGDGVTDNTAVFQQVLDEARKSGGGIVNVPAGRFMFAGTLSIPAGVTLQGTYRVPPAVTPKSDEDATGSTLLVTAGRGSRDAVAFITLGGNNASIAGFIIAYPEWRQTDVPPVPYPPCIASHGTENVGVSECLLRNPYEGIHLNLAHRMLVRNVTGYPSWRGLYITECMDVGRIENVHFWPFGVAFDPNDPFCRWVNTLGTAFEIAHTDWLYVQNTFCFGYGVGYRFTATDKGSANGNFSGLGADSCQRALLVEQAQRFGLLITNGEFVGRWGSTDAVGVEIGPEVKGKVSLMNCAIWGPLDRCVWQRGADSQFTATACHFVNWGIAGKDSPAIQLDAGKAIVQGSTFDEDHLAVRVAEPVRSAILTANQGIGGFHFENLAGKRTQSALNEGDTIEWTDEARSHYRIAAGDSASGRYLFGWQPPEVGARWSMPRSRLRLPVLRGKANTLTLRLNVPHFALTAEAGIYLKDQRLAPLTANETLTVTLPAVNDDHVLLELRCQGWIPKQQLPNSNDTRTLGVQLKSIGVLAEGGSTRVFDANAGEWTQGGKR